MQDKRLLIAGIVVCLAVAGYAFFQLTYCDEACEQRRRAEERREYLRKNPPPTPESLTNTSTQCPGTIETRWERPGDYRKFPTADVYKNPCAVYFRVEEGTMALAVYHGLVVITSLPNIPQGHSPTGHMHFDLVASFNGPARWTYILCHKWHEVMKQWRCR